MLFEERRTSAIIRLNYKRHLSHCKIITEAHAGAPTALLRPTAATNSAGRRRQRVLQLDCREGARKSSLGSKKANESFFKRCGRLFWSANYRFFVQAHSFVDRRTAVTLTALVAVVIADAAVVIRARN